MTLFDLPAYVVVFAIIGGTEVIDRTNFALIGLAAKYSPLRVWAGAALAFSVTTGLSVAIGTALLAALHGQTFYLRIGGGAVLLGYAAYLALKTEGSEEVPARRTAFVTAFLLILLLELGDTTMILTVVFVGTLPNPYLVGLAAALALVLVAASASLIGSRLGVRVEPAKLARIVIGVLIVVGLITLLTAFAPGLLPNVLR
ncbi:MAG: TMEM165/GDT1 family protein [Thermoplasmata archaeon]